MLYYKRRCLHQFSSVRNAVKNEMHVNTCTYKPKDKEVLCKNSKHIEESGPFTESNIRQRAGQAEQRQK